MIWQYGLSFLAGVLASGIWVLYVKAVTKNKALPAAAADLAIAVMGSGASQLWAMRQDDFWILAIWDIGGATGTYILIKYGFKK